MISKLHFRIENATLCGAQLSNVVYDSTLDESRVDCKNCLRKLPKWHNEQSRIQKYDEAHNIEIIITLPLKEWHVLESEITRTIQIYGLLGGISKIQFDFWKHIMDAPKIIKER